MIKRYYYDKEANEHIIVVGKGCMRCGDMDVEIRLDSITNEVYCTKCGFIFPSEHSEISELVDYKLLE